MQRGGDIAAAVRIRETGQPFFRYGETDWEFLKRMLGYGGLKPVPDAYSSRPRFYLGLRRGRLRELPGGSDVWMSFEGERYYRLSGKRAPVERRDFFCYHVSTWKELDLGERVRLEGRELGVHKKEMRQEA